MIISTFSVRLHLAAGEVNFRNRVATDILQMQFVAATVWLVSGASSLVIFKRRKRGGKKEREGGISGDLTEVSVSSCKVDGNTKIHNWPFRLLSVVSVFTGSIFHLKKWKRLNNLQKSTEAFAPRIAGRFLILSLLFTFSNLCRSRPGFIVLGFSEHTPVFTLDWKHLLPMKILS